MLFKVGRPQQPFRSHDINDKNGVILDPVKDPQRPDHEVAISGIRKIMGDRAHLGKFLKMLHAFENPSDQTAGSRRIVETRWLREKDALTLHDLADEFKVSAERIRQIEVKALQKMKGALVPA